MKSAQATLKEIKKMKSVCKDYNDLYSAYSDLLTLTELALEYGDESQIDEIKSDYKKFTDNLESIRLSTLLRGQYDSCNSIITLHAGAGGTEAQDWCEMLLRMYVRYAEKHSYKVETLDVLAGDEAGIKSVSILISGNNAYGYTKSEKGVHRLVRISPFDSAGRRHTSFVSVEVMPDIDDDSDVVINQDDLKIDTFRAGGAGGQHINKTDSAVRITHIPTGVVVSCQAERSQHKNKSTAMKMLKAKLAEILEREKKEKIQDIKGLQKEIAWGSQIRSYVFHPYSMVKDNRSLYETGNVSYVMDGGIDEFINAYLKCKNLGTLKE